MTHSTTYCAAWRSPTWRGWLARSPRMVPLPHRHGGREAPCLPQSRHRCRRCRCSWRVGSGADPPGSSASVLGVMNRTRGKRWPSLLPTDDRRWGDEGPPRHAHVSHALGSFIRRGNRAGATIVAIFAPVGRRRCGGEGGGVARVKMTRRAPAAATKMRQGAESVLRRPHPSPVLTVVSPHVRLKGLRGGAGVRGAHLSRAPLSDMHRHFLSAVRDLLSSGVARRGGV